MTKSKNDESNITLFSEQIKKFKKIFPECFDKNNDFIVERLLEIIGSENIQISKESYEINWLGKSYARLLANEKPRTLLTEDCDHNNLMANKRSNNLLIRGDNLEVLKHLTFAYSEQVKMIYIDPPYNTGTDGFTYCDDRKFTKEELAELAGIEEEEAMRILSFTQSNANSHSAWLTFMYPRLYVSRDLLKDSGVIFISIEDNEVAQLKLLCDLIMGEQNYLGTIIWKNATDNNPTHIATEHETIIVYAKSKDDLEKSWKSGTSEIKEQLINIGNELIEKHTSLDQLQIEYSKWFKKHKAELGELDRYKFIDFDGVYTGSQSVHNPGKEGYRYDVIHPITNKPCTEPLMGYRFTQSKMNELISKEKILFGKDHKKIVEIKVYAKDYLMKLPSIFKLDGRLGANELKELFPESKKVFTNPKPTKLIAKLISFATNESDLILDFFAGSGTTAHAVMQLNYDEGSSRQCISVQLDEPVTKMKGIKNSHKSIFEITKDRIQRVGIKIKKDHPKYLGDVGFKIFGIKPLDLFNLNDIKQLNPDQPTLPMISGDVDDLLITWKVFDGIPINQTLQIINLNGYRAHYMNKICYLMYKGFSGKTLIALLQELDDTENKFDIEKLVVYANHFNSKYQREISESLRQYKNKKEKKINIEFRY